MPTTLDDLRHEYGEFTFPVRDKYATAIPALDHQIDDALDGYVDLGGWKSHAVRAARLDMASQALSEGDGYGRKVTSFLDLCRAIALELVGWPPDSPPTGKAARRLVEATGRPASTLHRTLGIGLGGDARRFSFTTDLVLIDEASMIDAALMRQVLQACAPHTRLILVGDVDQRPPVGAGEPFYQIFQSGAPVVRLTHIHRQGRDSGIVWAAHGFNAGLVVDVAPFSDIDIVYVAGNQALRRTTLQQVAALLATHDLSIADVTVLTPLNKHDWGQEAMNLELQAEYNPGNPPLKACPFKEGDKVIHIKNVYDMRGQQVMNGMAGLVTWIASAGEEQVLMAKRAERGDDELPVILRVRFDGEDADTTYTRHELEYLKLAYALTIHKTQGSEYPYVVMLVPQTRDSFMMRQLAYTGLTRAKQRCVIISAQSALQAYVQNEERVRRVAFLAEMVQAGARGLEDAVASAA